MFKGQRCGTTPITVVRLRTVNQTIKKDPLELRNPEDEDRTTFRNVGNSPTAVTV